MQDEQDMAMAAVPQPQMEKCVEEYKPSNKEALLNHELSIRFLNRGCIVRVGCKEIAFEDHTNAMAAINAYVNNPWDEQQKWRKILA
jgi:hypothetical protein